jgi:hypothetical protein
LTGVDRSRYGARTAAKATAAGVAAAKYAATGSRVVGGVLVVLV